MSIYRAGVPARVYIGDQLASRVYKGDVLVWRRDPDAVEVTGNYTLTVPAYGAFLDVGVIGGGGGGATADNGASTANGKGGSPGVWQWTTVPVKPGDQFTFTIGAGGPGGAGGVKKSGTNGTQTTATGPGLSLVSPGGAGAAGSTANGVVTGIGATAVTTSNGHVLRGSNNVAARTVGDQPGGGGGGSPYKGWFQTPDNAAAGGPGLAAYRIRSY